MADAFLEAMRRDRLDAVQLNWLYSNMDSKTAEECSDYLRSRWGIDMAPETLHYWALNRLKAFKRPDGRPQPKWNEPDSEFQTMRHLCDGTLRAGEVAYYFECKHGWLPLERHVREFADHNDGLSLKRSRKRDNTHGKLMREALK